MEYLLYLLLLSKSYISAKALNDTQERCPKYGECWQCVGDPCSRTVKAETVNDICVWCEDYPGVGKGCISSRQDRACSPEPVKYTNTCPETTAGSTATGGICGPVITKYFIAHFELLSEDIYGVLEAIPLILDYRVWIAICGYVKDKEAVQQCGQHSPITVIQLHSKGISPPIDDSDRCWNIGQATSVAPSLVNESSPEEGIIFNYGSTPCCSESVRSIQVTVHLKPDDCQNGASNGTVTQGNFRSLTNCSDPEETLQIEAKTPVLCDENIEWRLSVAESTVHCNNTYTNQIRCVIDLRTMVTGRKASPSLKYCRDRFSFSLEFRNGSNLNTSLAAAEYRQTSCVFLFNSRDICNVSVLYNYPSAQSELLGINGYTNLLLKSCKKSNDVWGKGPIIGIAVFFVAIVMTVVLVAFFFSRVRRKRNSGNVQEQDSPKRRICRKPLGNGYLATRQIEADSAKLLSAPQETTISSQEQLLSSTEVSQRQLSFAKAGGSAPFEQNKDREVDGGRSPNLASKTDNESSASFMPGKNSAAASNSGDTFIIQDSTVVVGDGAHVNVTNRFSSERRHVETTEGGTPYEKVTASRV